MLRAFWSNTSGGCISHACNHHNLRWAKGLHMQGDGLSTASLSKIQRNAIIYTYLWCVGNYFPMAMHRSIAHIYFIQYNLHETTKRQLRDNYETIYETIHETIGFV